MGSEVGIDPKSLCYGFLNEIVAHPCSNGGPGITRLGCIKFNEGYSKFCVGCTKGSKVRSEVGMGAKSLCYGFLNEISTHPCSDGGPRSTSSDVRNFMKDVPNFMKNVPGVQKCVPKRVLTPNHLLMGL